ncbi:MAG TPA: hypothetical protein VMX17_17415 [Candidatus Glassbacteria bacterium]|nr:hypothetical protein [Candidatus Glassbacteria bacterium]
MDIELEIRKSTRLLHWLIDGYHRHCIPGDLWYGVTPEWVVKHYNVEMSYFTKP